MKYIMCSRTFPKGHPKAGQPTNFVDKILNSIYPGEKANLLNRLPPQVAEIVNDFFILDGEQCKHTTIRAGSRFKPGDMASLRVWSGVPRRSKQIEFAQVEVKKVWPVTIIIDDVFNPICSGDKVLPAGLVANNDGLEVQDFIDWFTIHPKKTGAIFTGQIISWNDSIEYGKPLLTEKIK